MKTEIIVGDTLNFLTSVPDYLASASWVLTYKLIPKAAGPAVITITTSAEGDDYRVNVAAATTAAWTTGDYSWRARVTKGAEAYRVDSGQVKLLADSSTATTLDNRSHERKVLDAIEACIENRASTTQREMVAYAIGNRSQQFDPQDSRAALLALHSKYKWLVANEDAREKIAAGQANPRMVGIRFGRP
jgi:hypothetical protein